jgi:hypothetical protein
MRDHYEEAYWKAREVLYRREKKVGKPVYRQDGLRYCPVDGSPLTDRDVLKEAWGLELADEILREWVPLRRRSPAFASTPTPGTAGRFQPQRTGQA